MSGAGRWLGEVALCAVFAVCLAGYFGPYLGFVPADPQGGGGGGGALASAYLVLLFAALLTLAVRLLPGRGPADAGEAGGENARRKGNQ